MILIKPISPVAIDLFGLQIRWYAIAYILAFLIGLWMIKKLAREHSGDKKYWDDLFAYTLAGVIIGGRLGYVLFYNPGFFLQNPLEIFAIWHGGMSFHGGLAGVMTSTLLFAWRRRESALAILDKLAVVAPIGLFFGRMANFINMEVMGRATSRAWGVVFEGLDTLPRHPSPLYEAGLEGILLFLIMIMLWKTRLKNHAGLLSGTFGILYGIFRIFCEQFREPDIQVGFLLGTDWLTMGMILSFIMIAAGLYLIAKSACRKKLDRI
ncbi:MAG: prolipoprotein diacylglyceryl transferase [Rickettsiales bacterium]|jgi:phosphatidylglycerol:prolipoprotein diacylglycerol transferase|nr:prolipoprotein diacylglyceryl transferase [Rickettsiales bacterium]